jgi:hypothetical protein
MFQPDKDGIYAVVAASGIRRIIACFIVYALGALVVYISIIPPFKAVLTPLVLVLGLAILWVAEKLRRSTLTQIIMTDEAISDSNGLVLARIEDILAVDRGAFAMKPSNGFTLKLKSKQPRGWAPGLWWRLGNRVGVGGATAAGQSKFMAEQIALRIAGRERS